MSRYLFPVAAVAIACASQDAPVVAATPAPSDAIPATVALTPSAGHVLVGDRARFRATVQNAAGATVPAAVAWSIDSPGIASVDEFGVVVGLSPGNTILRATSGPAAGEAPINIGPDTAVSILTRILATPLFVGDTRNAAAEVLSTANRVLSEPTIRWSTSDSSVATVSPDGVIRGVGAGIAGITASFGTVSSSPAAIRVLSTGPIRVTGSTTLVPGSDAQLAALGVNVLSRSWSAVPATWTSDDSTVVAIDQNGVVTGRHPGSTTVHAATAGGTVDVPMVTRVLDGRIAYAVDGVRIGTMTLDGSDPSFVPGFALGGPSSVALSPDGRLLAFDCPTGVCWGDSRGGQVNNFQLLYEAASIELSWPSWLENDGLGVLVRGTDLEWAGLRTQLPSGYGSISVNVRRPRVARDGFSFLFECDSDLCSVGAKQLVFAHNAARAAVFETPYAEVVKVAYDTPLGLCTVPPSGGSCTIIYTHDASTAIEPAWSPDGAHVVFAKARELWLIDADGSNLVRLARAAVDGGVVSSPSWAPIP